MILTLLAILLLQPMAGEQNQPSSLPREWHGVWSGKLVISGDKSSEVAMTLRVEPIKDSKEVTWAITYGEGAKASLRNYKLVPDGDKAGRFFIDERNGTLLDTRLVNGVIYTQFEVGGSLLTARYELRGDTMHYELTSAKPAVAKTGKGKIQGYRVETVQSGVLKKQVDRGA